MTVTIQGAVKSIAEVRKCYPHNIMSEAEVRKLAALLNTQPRVTLDAIKQVVGNTRWFDSRGPDVG